MKNENTKNENMTKSVELDEQELSNISGGTAGNHDLEKTSKEGEKQMKLAIIRPSGEYGSRFG